MGYPIYSSKDVKVSWVGYNIQGLADGTFLSFEFSEDVFTARVGADGKISKSYSPDKTATLTLTLLQESPSNAALSWALASAKNGLPVEGAMTIVDPSGSVLALLRGVSLMRGPTVELGKEAGDREYQFFIEDLDYVAAPDKLSDDLDAGDLAAVTSGIATLASKIGA